MIFFKKILPIALYIFIMGIVTLSILEIVYRYMWIDFYQAELNYFNSEKDLKQTNIDLLVLGDSFSAGMHTYVQNLRDTFPDKTIINSAITGTGIKQANYIAARRIKKFQPKNILYQVYLGNDLIDLKYPINWHKISFARNMYWTVAEYFRVVSFINYRLAFLKKNPSSTFKSQTEQDFHPTLYTKRTRMYLEANPHIYEDMMVLNSPYEEVYYSWQEEFKKTIAHIPKECNLYLVFIPHCTQVSDNYVEAYQKLGMDIQNASIFNQKNNHFFQKTQQHLENNSNVFLLNPLAFLRAANHKGTKLYFNNDPHFNAKGHEVLAQFLAQHLVTMK